MASKDQLYFLTEHTPLALHLAKILSLTSTAFLCGRSFHATVSATPALLSAPAPLLARQWKTMFDSDKLIASILVLFGGTTFSYLAYREHKFNRTAKLYAGAASVLLACIPYSMLLQHPLAEKLILKARQLAVAGMQDAAAEVGIKAEETVHYLVDRWATANLGRAALAGLSSLLAAWAAVSTEEVVGASFDLAGGATGLGK